MYIKTLDDLIEVLNAQKQNLGTYQTELGATAQDITDVMEERENAIYLKEAGEGVQTDSGTFFQMKDSYLNGPLNGPVGAAAVFQVFTWPHGPVVGGKIAFANTRNRRFRNSPTYTDEAGEACKVSSTPVPPPDPGTITPVIEKASPAQANYLFSIIVGNRGESDQYQVFTQPVEGSHPWVLADTVTTRAADVTYTVPGGGLDGPQQVRVRVQLRRKGENYGLLSQTETLTLNP